MKYQIDLPRPRDIASAEFNEWRRLLSSQLHSHHRPQGGLIDPARLGAGNFTPEQCICGRASVLGNASIRRSKRLAARWATNHPHAAVDGGRWGRLCLFMSAGGG